MDQESRRNTLSMTVYTGYCIATYANVFMSMFVIRTMHYILILYVKLINHLFLSSTNYGYLSNTSSWLHAHPLAKSTLFQIIMTRISYKT